VPPDDGDDDGGWEPGGDGDPPSPLGLGVLLVVGAYALWEYKRPGGILNPQTKKDVAMRQYRGESTQPFFSCLKTQIFSLFIPSRA
jgi:hypothetical protein